MAGGNTESFNNRQLWQTISGTGFLRPEEFIEHELKKNQDKLLQGFSYYKKQRKPSGEALKDRKLKKTHHDFILKLSQLLGLDELQSHDLFCAFLFTEYRGTQKELTHILSHERHSQTLLFKIQDFYNGERLYLLRCLRHILHCWLEGEHVYKDVFARFLNQLLAQNLLGQKLQSQFEEICTAQLPTRETHGSLMGRGQVMAWAVQNLKEQVELLELLMIYYKDFEMNITTLMELFASFKKHSFGWGQSYKHLVDGPMEKLVQRIGNLEVLIVLEGLDIMTAVTAKKESNLSEHVIFCDPANVEKLHTVFSQLGSEPIHGPLVLGWCILQYIQGEVDQTQEMGDTGETVTSTKTFGRAHRMGNVALQLGVFDFFIELLDSEPFCGKSDLGSIANYIVYSVMSALLSVFHEDSLGNTEALTRIISKLFRWDYIGDTVWDKDNLEGLALFFQSAQTWFPLDFASFMQLNISLASASQFSAHKVKSNLHSLKVYTELLDNNRAQDLQTSREQGIFILRRRKHPYQNSDFAIEGNCKGTVINPSSIRRNLGNIGHVIRWEATVNGWQMLMGEIQELLAQVSHGAGMVQPEQLIKVSMIMELIKAVMTSDPVSVPEFTEILNLGYQLIVRFAVLNPAHLELLGHTIQCLACAIPQFHSQVSHHLKQTGLLPFLTENIDDFSEVLNGDGVNQGLYGCVLASTECAHGVYTVTLAVLDLVTKFVDSSSKQGKENEYMASVLFILREVFPRYHKWRYVDISHRKNIGQKCLQLFHKIFNFVRIQEKQVTTTKKGPGLQESCVFSLLFTEAGRALLEIVATGVDNIQLALAQQSSLLEGPGADMVELIEMSLSLLNRLLLLKPPSLGPSPVEQALSSQPPGRQHQHLVATIAQYIYHRHSHRLPVLATLLLKRLAMVSPMSILACLGNDSEPIRDMYLTRLQAVSEDVQLKVGILELLSVCVDTQPGLLEIFLNVQQQGELVTDKAKHDLKLGRNSCLPILLDLMEVGKQCTYECPPELLCACLDLVHSLWQGMRETPMTVLREKQTFWPSVLDPLKTDLPQVQEDDDLSVQALKLRTKLCSFSLRIIAMEVYAMSSAKLGENFKKSLQSSLSNERLMYWSKAVRSSVETVGETTQDYQPNLEQTISDHPALNLLLAWKNLLVTSSRLKVAELQLTDRNKGELHQDLLICIQSQFKSSETTQVKVKLASIASALYFTLIKTWGREYLDRQMSEFGNSPRTISGPAAAVRNLTQTIQDSVSGNQLLPSVQIGLLGTVTTIFQQCGNKLDNLPSLIKELLPVVCSVFLQSSRHLPALLESMDKDKDGKADPGTSQQSDAFGVNVKLQIVSCCLMVEILHISPDLTLSLKTIQEHGIVPCLLATMEAFFKARQGISYIYSALLLLTKIADTEMGANMLASSNLTSHLCLVLTSSYSCEDSMQPRNLLSTAFSSLKPATVSWHSLYCLSLDLFSSMLRVLRHTFLDDAFNVAGVHQDRLQQSLEVARVNLNTPALREADATISFILQLCPYQRQWRFHLPDVLAKLMGSLMAMVQTYMALLVRPRYLQHVLQHHKKQEGAGKSDTILQTPSYLQHQTSLDDVEQPTSKLIESQHSMLKLAGKSLASLRHFTPPLPEILLDQSTDVTEWIPILGLGFGTPSLDDDVEGITFGTLLNCVTICVRHLARTDSKSLSPHRGSPEDSNKHQIPRPVVHFALETSLDILMSQACRYLRDPSLLPRDRQFLKRELGTELNSCLSPLHRQLRRGAGDRSSMTSPHHPTPSTPGGLFSQSASSTGTAPITPQTTTTTTSSGSGGRPTLHPQLSRSVSQTFGATHDPAYFRLVQEFVQKVLK